ncbi:MAG: hypothetical protein HDS09_02130 [Bacteroides sp.]|nr:hypothetical protein [Bacteroides sp.]
MKQIAYNKTMLVTDLILTSIWILFAVKSTPGIEYWKIVVIFMRIVLSFQLFDCSRWSGYCAIIFACAYSMLPGYHISGFQNAPFEMIYYALHIVDWDMAHELGLHPYAPIFQISIYVIWGLLTGWLVLMPVIILIINKNMFKFPKWAWINIILFALIALLGLRGYTIYDLCTFWVVGACYLPELYWIIVNGRKKSLVAAIYRNKPLVYYCAFVALFLCAMTIGFKNFYIMRPFGLICFPVIFYILLGKSEGIRDIPTYDTLFMCISGSLYWFCLEFRGLERIIGFVISALILIIVGVRLAKFTSSKFIGISLVVGSAFILYPAMWGMNPYTVLDGHTCLYMKKWRSYDGVYVTDNFDGKCGLRDRYGEILPMKYFTIDILDGGRYQKVLLCCLESISDDAACPEEDDKSYTFFNIHTRQFIKIPDDIQIKNISLIRKGVYALFNEADTPAFYLVMPEYGGHGDDGKYSMNFQIIDKRSYPAPIYDNVEIPEDAETLLSSDAKVRLISWDTGLGGTSPDYISCIQYQANDSLKTDFFYPHSEGKYVCATDLNRNGYEVYDGSRIDGLWQIDSEGELPIYIVATYNRASSIEGNTSVYALQFDDQGKLKKKQFLDERGELLDVVGRDYHIPDWDFATDGMGWNWIVSMDDSTQYLYVAEDKYDMAMTDRYDVYHYEKGRMIYKGTAAGHWLHPSVRKFDYLCCIYRTKERLYRVDWAASSYRLSIWDSNKSMGDKPETIIHNGQARDNFIKFTNDSYTFIVPLYRKGQGDDFDRVIIMKDSKIIKENEI